MAGVVRTHHRDGVTKGAGLHQGGAVDNVLAAAENVLVEVEGQAVVVSVGVGVGSAAESPA